MSNKKQSSYYPTGRTINKLQELEKISYLNKNQLINLAIEKLKISKEFLK